MITFKKVVAVAVGTAMFNVSKVAIKYALEERRERLEARREGWEEDYLALRDAQWIMLKRILKGCYLEHPDFLKTDLEFETIVQQEKRRKKNAG